MEYKLNDAVGYLINVVAGPELRPEWALILMLSMLNWH